MAISLKDPRTDQFARALSALTGESLTEAVRKALEERLDRENLRRRAQAPGLADRLEALGKACAALPDADMRTADEIVGYDENGMWR